MNQKKKKFFLIELRCYSLIASSKKQFYLLEMILYSLLVVDKINEQFSSSVFEFINSIFNFKSILRLYKYFSQQ